MGQPSVAPPPGQSGLIRQDQGGLACCTTRAHIVRWASSNKIEVRKNLENHERFPLNFYFALIVQIGISSFLVYGKHYF